jgi:hypothetical protein
MKITISSWVVLFIFLKGVQMERTWLAEIILKNGKVVMEKVKEGMKGLISATGKTFILKILEKDRERIEVYFFPLPKERCSKAPTVEDCPESCRDNCFPDGPIFPRRNSLSPSDLENVARRRPKATSLN